MFEVGQKVVCVDAGPSYDGVSSRLVLGAVYTVSHPEVVAWDGSIGMRVSEFAYFDQPGGYCIHGHKHYRFRPLDEIEAGMQMLRAFVKQPKQRIKERA